MVKNGIKTVEFWLMMAATILTTVWPEIPNESLIALGTWIIGRSSQKLFGMVDPLTGKASWETSEFWITICYAVIKIVFPDIPEESLVAVLTWTGLRTSIKITTVSNFKKAA